MGVVLSYIGNMIQLILAPGKAWEDISHDGDDPSSVERNLMFPLFAAAGLSVFVQSLYHDEDVLLLVISCAVTFVSFLITFAFGRLCFTRYLDKYVDGEANMRKGQTVIAYVMSLLALSSVICNVLPFKMGLQYLLPLAISMIGWKSNRYLAVKHDNNGNFALLILLSLILPPIVLQTILSWAVTV